MDNLAHTLAATALAKTPLGKRTPLSAVALVVAANLPDLDIVSGLWESPAYLVHHRGITHSLLGIAAQAILLAAVFGCFERPRWGTFPAVLVGLLSHFFLDALNTYGVRPWLPFSNEWYYGDLVFIVDPYLWLLFAAMTFVPHPHARAGNIVFALFLLGTGWLVLTHPRAPDFLKIVYPVGIAGLALLRWRGISAASANRWIGAVAVLCGVYLGALAWIKHRIAQGLAPAPHVMSPYPAQPWKWGVVQTSGDEIIWSQLELGTAALPAKRALRQLERPGVRRAMEGELGKAWLRFARIPFADVEERDGISIIHLMDARYQESAPAGWSGVRISLD